MNKSVMAYHWLLEDNRMAITPIPVGEVSPPNDLTEEAAISPSIPNELTEQAAVDPSVPVELTEQSAASPSAPNELDRKSVV